MKIPFFDLRNEAEQELYILIDQRLRKLTRGKDGSIDSGSDEFHDNDVDAIRHAYVSGVFTREYGSAMADVLGRLNELFPLNGASDTSRVQSTNMDLWNNAVGQRYGQEFRTRSELFEALLNALKKGELIQNLRDRRNLLDRYSKDQNSSSAPKSRSRLPAKSFAESCGSMPLGQVIPKSGSFHSSDFSVCGLYSSVHL